jgi:Ca2+-binding RTX toxin-like protein
MPTVTVAGAHGQIVSLTFDSASNAALAQKLASAITVGVQDGTIIPAVDTDGLPPPVPSGKIGEWVQTHDGTTILPSGYNAVVDTAADSTIFSSGGNGESVLSSVGDLTFFAATGSGTVVAGGGDNRVILLSTDTGSWSINTGNGDDTVLAEGSGNDTINAGGGNNSILLGSGKDVVLSTGDDTVTASDGQETISATGKGGDLVYGNASKLFFVTNVGGATVLGGTGSDTFFGGKGTDLVYGGTGGNNFLVAGTGAATLFGGGNGDQLFGAGSMSQALHAGAGNETLSGGAGGDTFYGSAGSTVIYGGFGADTFVAGSGAATITSGFTSNLFVFNNGQAGGSESVQGFVSGRDLIDLQGYGSNEVKLALKSQQLTAGGDMITLSDNTTITFAGITNLTASDFVTSSGSAMVADAVNSSAAGQFGSHDFNEPHTIRNGVIGHS